MKVGTLCTRDTVIITPDETLGKAATLMKNYDVGSLVVVGEVKERNRPIAIVTDRDIVLKAVAHDKGSSEKLYTILSEGLITANEEDLLFDTLEKMRYAGIRRIVVVDDEGFLVGVLSIDDIIDFFSDEIGTISELIEISRKKEDKRK